MAAVIFYATAPKIWLRQHLETVVSGCRKLLDAFVSSRMQRAVAEVQEVSPRQSRPPHPDAPADRSETPVVQLGPLDPNVLSDAIPAFFIGRNKAGLWVAREANGRIGGIFLLKNSALGFARAQSEMAGCATVFPSERFELDLEYHGNPFAALLVPPMQSATEFWCWIGGIGNSISNAAKRTSGTLSRYGRD